MVFASRGTTNLSVKVGIPQMAPNLKAPSLDCVHFQNQLCTYLDEALSETNFDP